MHSLRNGLQRHFLVHRAIDIINDDFFKDSNACFHNMLKMIKSTTKGIVKHYPEIEPEDLLKLYKSLSTETPRGLLEKVWLDIMFFFIRRGRENKRQMTKDTFATGCDAAGKRYFYQVLGEIDKNHKVNDGQYETSGEGRMYETESALCPYNSFVKYLKKLNSNQSSLWQRPKGNFSIHDETWFCDVPIGEKTLGGMMATLSSKYDLSQRYTNHSIRVTGLQALEDSNFEGRHIIRISGHKSENSIKNYARKLSASRKRSMSSALSSMVDEELNINPKENTSTPEPSKKQMIATATSEDSFDSHHLSSISPIDFNFDTTNDDDSFFDQIPTSLLQSSSSIKSRQHHMPVFNNCSVTINYNFYNKN